MKDGLYQVKYKTICAGFEIKDAKVIAIAPILKKKFNFWKTIARKIR